jgi:hypothetical protein
MPRSRGSSMMVPQVPRNVLAHRRFWHYYHWEIERPNPGRFPRMKAVSCSRWGVRGAASLLALLAVLHFAPATGHAGCGDYVMVGPSSSALPHPVASSVFETAHSSPSKPSVPTPCSGPNCSRAPVETPITPPAPSDGPDDQWASVLDFVAADAPGLFSWTQESSGLGPVRHSSLIYHPPR